MATNGEFVAFEEHPEDRPRDDVPRHHLDRAGLGGRVVHVITKLFHRAVEGLGRALSGPANRLPVLVAQMQFNGRIHCVDTVSISLSSGVPRKRRRNLKDMEATMDQAATLVTDGSKVVGPPRFNHLDHVSMPCRDLEEGIRFYRDVLGGEIIVTDPAFALFRIAGMRVGIGSVGCSFMIPQAEYPHIAFNADADALLEMKEWLSACGIPTSGYWTRKGIETLMFFRDPSGNVIELFCDSGFDGASDLPRGPSRGHGTTIDIDALAYTTWRLPGDAA